MKMDDRLTAHLRERFAGHEVDVPPGAWENVNQQLQAGSGEALRNTLQDKFRGHEVHVDPSAWSAISGQLGHTAAAGTSFGTAWIAAGVAAVAITATALLWNSNADQVPAPVPQQVVQAVPPATPSPATTNPVVTPPTPKDPAPEKQTNAEPAVAPPAHHTPMVNAPATTKAEPQAEATAPKTPTLPVVHTSSTTPSPTGNAGQAQPPAPPVQASAFTPAAKQDEPAEHNGSTTSGNTVTSPNTETATDETGTDPFQQENNSAILIPNVFSPQGDGVNDQLKIIAKDYEKADVRIYSSKSDALVFHSNDLARMWDGRLPNGNIADEGYYRCIVILTDPDGTTRVKTEVVRLFR
jgi:hypothetical protein